MALESRTLKVGTRLAARYKGKDYIAEVVKHKDGIRYRLADGKEFKSPSAAGSAVMGGGACNGWRFWTLAGGARKPPAKNVSTKGASKKNPKHIFEPMPDQAGAPAGQVRFFCSGCMEGFTAPAGVDPVGCPKGHPAA